MNMQTFTNPQRMEDTGALSCIIEYDLAPQKWAPPTVNPNNHTTDLVVSRRDVPSPRKRHISPAQHRPSLSLRCLSLAFRPVQETCPGASLEEEWAEGSQKWLLLSAHRLVY